MDGQVDGQINRWVGGWVSGWVDGSISENTMLCKFHASPHLQRKKLLYRGDTATATKPLKWDISHKAAPKEVE